VQFAPSAFDFSRAVGVLPALLRRGPPIVVSLHEYGVWSASPPLRRIGETLWAAAERRGLVDRETLLFTAKRVQLVVTNPEHAALVAARFPAGGRDPLLVPIGPNIGRVSIQRGRARRLLRQRFGAGPAAPVVVFFGFLHPVKDLDRLIRAVGVLRCTYPDIRLVLMGGAQSHSMPPRQAARLRSQLEDEARRHGVADNVVLTGYLPAPEISGNLLAADVAVFPFKNGVTMKSGSLLAALSHGLPVIATSPEGGAAMPREDRGVLWVAPRNTAALVRAIDEVLVDPDLRARLRRAGTVVIEGHQWSCIAAAHARIYAELLHGRSSVRMGATDVDG
jgi:glycosyltransferase involved in cell wall biosynthesis